MADERVINRGVEGCRNQDGNASMVQSVQYHMPAFGMAIEKVVGAAKQQAAHCTSQENKERPPGDLTLSWRERSDQIGDILFHSHA